ncbi:hypothetical protein OPQ81_010897 [Rhizoctonia solani]|nr:hypothetical protein OPQ81_010897 [Rhizoctonia solani]
MAFELSKSTTTTRSRSKLGQSTAAPPAPTPVEEDEKPRRKKSTRSRSSSPSKKRSSAAAPVVDETPTFPVAQMETMAEEPEPESEPKLRRSPRKARSTSTRLGSVSTGVSPFASTSSQPTSDKTSENAQPESSSAPETPAEPEPEPKPKRSSRTVGRSKSKSRGKSAKIEETLNEDQPRVEEPAPVEEHAASTPVVEREATPIVRETTPMATQETTSVTAGETTPVPPQHASPLATTRATPPTAIQSPPSATSQTPQIPVQATSPAASSVVSPTSRPAPTTRQSLATVPTSQPARTPVTRQSLAPATTSRQSLAPTSDPTPFKFNLPPSFGRRTQSLAPTPATPGFSSTLTPSFPTTPFPVASTPVLSNPVSALPSPALALSTPGPANAFAVPSSSITVASPSPAIASDPPPETPGDKEDDLKYEQPSKEEEEEAVAAAMRITRRDSSIFASLMSPLRPSLVPEPNLAPSQSNESDSISIQEQDQETCAPTEPVPVPKRTRVGRGSTRVRGGAGVAVAAMGRVAQDEDVERVEALIEPQGQEQEQQEQVQEIVEEKHVIEDVTVPVNFGSRSPSPTPPPPPPEEPKLAESKPKPSFGTRTTRTTRASMPTATATTQPARTTRSMRRSEVQPPTSRGLAATPTVKETLIGKPAEIEDDIRNDGDKPTGDVSTPTHADAPTGDSATFLGSPRDLISPPHGTISTTPVDSPVVSTCEGPVSVSSKTHASQKALGSKGPQRVAARAASSAATASQQNVSGSGSSQSQPRRTASSGSAKPPSTGTKPASADGSQRAGGPAQKPAAAKPAASRKPASTENKPALAIVGDMAQQVSEPNVPHNEPEPEPEPESESEPEVRAVRALPKRASQSSKVPTIMEDSMEISMDEIREVDTGAEQATPVQDTKPVPLSSSIWPREPAPNPFAPANPSVAFHGDSPRTNKRRAPSPEPETEPAHQAASSNDSPNKRVRFTAVLEAGPTPGVGRVLQMPKPSLKKVKKIKIERKAIGTANANRPKRVLRRDWVVGGDMPSYAAPLKRDVREREVAAAGRPPLVESQANTRATTSKLNPTVPIPFTFRSELRMKPHSAEDPSLPTPIPIAAPMPDFAAAHAAAEAANLARRQRAHEAFLAAQAELESYRTKHMIGGETARRAAERAVFDAAMKVKEAEAERIRNEQKRFEAERAAAEIREMRKKMVPKANPVPEFYKHVPRSEAQDLES